MERPFFFERWLSSRSGHFIGSKRVDETCLLLCVVNGRLVLLSFLSVAYAHLRIDEGHLWNHIPHWEIGPNEYVKSPAYPLWLAAKYLRGIFHAELSSRFIVDDSVKISCCHEPHWETIDFKLCHCRRSRFSVHSLWDDDSIPKQNPPANQQEIERTAAGLRTFDMNTAERWLKQTSPCEYFRQPKYRVFLDASILVLPWEEGNRQYCLGTYDCCGEYFVLVYDFNRLYLRSDTRQGRPMPKEKLAGIKRKISKRVGQRIFTMTYVPSHIVSDVIQCAETLFNRWTPTLHAWWRHRSEFERELSWSLRMQDSYWNRLHPFVFRDHGAGQFAHWKMVFEKLPLLLIFVCPEKEEWEKCYVASLYQSQTEYYYARQQNYRNVEIYCVTVRPPETVAPPPEMATSDDPHLRLCTLEEVEEVVSSIIRDSLPMDDFMHPQNIQKLLCDEKMPVISSCVKTIPANRQSAFVFTSDSEYTIKLLMAVEHGCVEQTETLLRSGHVPPIPEELYSHKLESIFRNDQLFYLLMTYGMDLSRTFGGYSALHLCISDRIGHSHWTLPQKAMSLVLKKSPLEIRDPKGKTPLHYAVDFVFDHHPVDEALTLIDCGADVRAQDNLGNTPLHRCMNVKLLESLLAHGAEIESENRRGFTPLLTHCGIFSCLEFFINHNARLDVATLDGAGPCHCWALFRHLKWDDEDALPCLELLLSRECPLNTTDFAGNTPLHYLMREMAEIFSEHYVNVRDVVRNTFSLYQTACAKGADRLRRNRKGETPIELWENRTGLPRKLLADYL